MSQYKLTSVLKLYRQLYSPMLSNKQIVDSYKKKKRAKKKPEISLTCENRSPRVETLNLNPVDMVH